MSEQLVQGGRHGRGRGGDRSDRRKGAAGCRGSGALRPRPPRRPIRRAQATPALAGDETPRRASTKGTKADDEVMTLSPAVRRAVLEHHVDPSTHSAARARTGGSPRTMCSLRPRRRRAPAQPGPRRRRRKPRVRSRALRSWPRPSPANGERNEERVKMSRLRQTIANRLKDAQNTAAMLTTFNDVDMIGGHRRAEPLQGSVREEARHSARLHGLLRESVRARGASDVPVGQRPPSRATRSSITTISTFRSRSRRPRAWWSR